MSCLGHAAIKEPLVDTVGEGMINSNTCMILDLDLVRMNKDDVNFSNEYELIFSRTDRAHAIVAWFDVQFSDLENPVTLSTSPYKKYTHWKQTVFYLDQDLKVYEGDVLKGSIAVR
jgi:protein arginine N-methyltransferase 1